MILMMTGRDARASQHSGLPSRELRMGACLGYIRFRVLGRDVPPYSPEEGFKRGTIIPIEACYCIPSLGCVGFGVQGFGLPVSSLVKYLNLALMIIMHKYRFTDDGVVRLCKLRKSWLKAISTNS